jgi:heptosyltransferase-3
VNILFITHTRIGDAVLSSGLLRYLVEKYPDARFTIACGPMAQSLFAAVPRLDRVVVMTKRRFDGHWFDLWRQVRGTVWDIVVDLRRSLVSYVIRVRKRYVIGPIAEGVHHVEHLSALLSLPAPASPSLYTAPENRAAAVRLIPDGAPVLALAPIAAAPIKTWPAERFAALAAQLTAAGAVHEGWRVALFGGPGDEVRAAPLRHPGRISIFDESDLLTVYAALGRCQAFIGNDSGLSHLAAAAGIPTLALFGPTDSRRYGPWGGHIIKASHGDLANLAVDPVAIAHAKSWHSRNG